MVGMVAIMWTIVSLALGWFLGVLITKMRASKA